MIYFRAVSAHFVLNKVLMWQSRQIWRYRMCRMLRLTLHTNVLIPDNRSCLIQEKPLSLFYLENLCSWYLKLSSLLKMSSVISRFENKLWKEIFFFAGKFFLMIYILLEFNLTLCNSKVLVEIFFSCQQSCYLCFLPIKTIEMFCIPFEQIYHLNYHSNIWINLSSYKQEKCGFYNFMIWRNM